MACRATAALYTGWIMACGGVASGNRGRRGRRRSSPWRRPRALGDGAQDEAERIQLAGTTSDFTEMKIVSGADGFQTVLRHGPITLEETGTDARWGALEPDSDPESLKHTILPAPGAKA
jgi:hypothetical protein